MSKVKLLSNLQLEKGVAVEGSVVDLPEAEAEHLVTIGAAEATDEPVGEAKPEVEPAADPLPATQADGEQTPKEATPANEPAEPSTPPAPASSSANLHLG